jgi:hypothetical protein
MFRALLYILLIYLGYQFIFNFLIPVYRTTQKVRKGFREMSERMDQSNGHQETKAFHDKNQSSSSQQTQSEGSRENDKVGEYIDFEDVK